MTAGKFVAAFFDADNDSSQVSKYNDVYTQDNMRIENFAVFLLTGSSLVWK